MEKKIFLLEKSLKDKVPASDLTGGLVDAGLACGCVELETLVLVFKLVETVLTFVVVVVVAA